MKLIISLTACLLFTLFSPAQTRVLQPGFDGQEYLRMLSIFSRCMDTVSVTEEVPAPDQFDRIYRSPEVGLRNRWDLWQSKQSKLDVICIRGTIADPVSWMENFFAAMVKASGTLKLNDSTSFTYQLADDPKATVHAGWTIGLAALAPTITEQIRIAYANGVRDFAIMGHSQGGALAFLLRSYLFYETKNGRLPADIRYKTFCSAAPKPGNMYYAYDFDFITRNGWAFTIVNASDWVPETPFSIQTLNDFNPVNPFVGIDDILKQQKLLFRIAGRHIFNRLRKPPEKAQRNFQKYLGDYVYKQVRKQMPQLDRPVFASDNNYMRAGVPIILKPDDRYRSAFPDNPKRVFLHHFLWPYYSLCKQYYVDQSIDRTR